MSSRQYFVAVLLVGLIVVGSGCGSAETPVSEPTEVQATERSATEPPQPTATEEEPTATREPTDEPEPTLTPTSRATPTMPPVEEATQRPLKTEEPATPEGQVLMEERCTGCHSLGRVQSAQKTREAWTATVDRMIGYGTQLSDAERLLLLDYLAETYGP